MDKIILKGGSTNHFEFAREKLKMIIRDAKLRFQSSSDSTDLKDVKTFVTEQNILEPFAHILSIWKQNYGQFVMNSDIYTSTVEEYFRDSLELGKGVNVNEYINTYAKQHPIEFQSEDLDTLKKLFENPVPAIRNYEENPTKTKRRGKN